MHYLMNKPADSHEIEDFGFLAVISGHSANIFILIGFNQRFQEEYRRKKYYEFSIRTDFCFRNLHGAMIE